MKVRTNRMRIYADPVHAETELTRQKRSPAQRHPSFLQQSREIPAEGLEKFAYNLPKRMSGMFFDFKRCGNLVP